MPAGRLSAAFRFLLLCDAVAGGRSAVLVEAPMLFVTAGSGRAGRLAGVHWSGCAPVSVGPSASCVHVADPMVAPGALVMDLISAGAIASGRRFTVDGCVPAGRASGHQTSYPK